MALGARDRVVLDTLLPADADPVLPEGVLDPGFDAFHAEFERAAPPVTRRAFRLALLAATWIAPLLVRARPPLSRHPRDVRERALEAMARSRVAVLRQLLVLLKLVAALSYGGRPDVREHLGYPGGPLP
jgi:hypothetical protein